MNVDDDPAAGLLLAEIAGEAGASAALTGRPQFAPRVLEALRRTPRQEFVPLPLRACAWDNRPLPIGHEQTISQPYIVALMTDLIDPREDATVLEIGTGSGYQAAVLSRLVRRVVSLEIIPELAALAAQRLARLGCDNVEVHAGNGRLGWPACAPYDAIVVTAAAPHVPPALPAQLKPGGTLVMPVGEAHVAQELIVGKRRADGGFEQRAVLPVVFVPLTGGGR